MLEKLKKLVFGLEEFEKTKIELRFELIKTLIHNIEIQNIQDFENFEAVIYKIKDQLRVRSSNLNKIIMDPKSSLKKRDVLEILEQLNNIKYSFLKEAFNLMTNKTNIKQIQPQTPNIEEQIPQEPKQETQTKIEEKEPTPNPQEKQKENLIIKENEYVKITLENGKIPYAIVDFKKNIDFTTLKHISGAIFESYNAHGTNILTQENKALIIPRIQDDNLFMLPRVQVDIEEVFAKIQKVLNHETDGVKEAEYIEINNPHQTFTTKKKEEDSLDALLDKVQEKEKKEEFKPKIDPKKDSSKVEVIEDETITIEKKKEEIQSPQIEKIIKGEQPPKEDIQIQEEKENEQESPQEIQNTTKSANYTPQQFEIYKDQKIVCYLNENSKVIGELIVKYIESDKPNESDFSYMMIFAKAFSAILFEITQSHGTNIILDFENYNLKIIPRFQNDNLKLNWIPKEESDGFLEEIKTKLLTQMHSHIKKETNENTSKEKTKEISKEESDELKKKKAEHILKHIRKIP